MKTIQTEKILFGGVRAITTTTRVGNFGENPDKKLMKALEIFPGKEEEKSWVYAMAAHLGNLHGEVMEAPGEGKYFANGVLSPGNMVIRQTEIEIMGTKAVLPARVTFEKIDFITKKIPVKKLD